MFGSLELLGEIRARIAAAGGRITFAQFMELALYHPALGYYTRPGVKIGRHGDFTTAPALTPLFGQMVARQVAAMWQDLGRPLQFQIVEVGAGRGDLALGLLSALPDALGAAARYAIVEISPHLRSQQQEVLTGLGVQWWDRLPPGGITGVILSNELFDVMPVHLLAGTDQDWREVYVVWSGRQLAEEPDTPSSPLLAAVLADGGVRPARGVRAGVSLQAAEMLQSMGRAIDRGFVITIDYGDLATALYGPKGPGGDVRCYFKHFLLDSPYEQIGHQDITANVNFSHLIATGRAAGLTCRQFCTQGEFLLEMGLGRVAAELAARVACDKTVLPTLDKIRVLIDPGGMGTEFKVLVQEKGINSRGKN